MAAAMAQGGGIMVKRPTGKGTAQRQRILAELARRYVEFEPHPSGEELREMMGMGRGTLDYHLRVLRGAGLVHPDDLWITRLGLAETRPDLGLTS